LYLVEILEEAQMKSKLYVMLIAGILVVLLAVPRAKAMSGQILGPHACYVPTKIVFNFPATTNVSFTDVSTISGSAGGYEYMGSPTSFTFIAKEVDIYTFVLAVHVTNATAANQTNMLFYTLWSGTLAPGDGAVSSDEADFYVQVRLSTTQQPIVPSAQEIAQLEFHLVEQRFVEMFNQLTGQNERIAQLTTNNAVITLLALVASALALFFAVAYKRKEVASYKGKLVH
jgi:hypothetical protein